jgi:hypothetical protein
MKNYFLLLIVFIFIAVFSETTSYANYEKKDFYKHTDSAAKLGIKGQEEIVDLAKWAKKTSGNEIGAVGNIDKLIEAAKGPHKGNNHSN